METNNYTTDLQLVSQEYSDFKPKPRHAWNIFHQKTFGKLRECLSPVSWPASCMSLT